jgi:phosphatidylserine decarboxylase
MCHISQTRGIGTIRSHQHGPEYEDDGLSSDEADVQEGEASDDEDEIERKSSTPDESNLFTPPADLSSTDLTPTPSPTAALPPTQQARNFLPSIPKILTRRPVRRTSTPSDASSSSPQSQSASTSRHSSLPTPTPGKRRKIPGPWKGQTSGGFELEADNDIMGIIMFEIHSATDLPRLRNSKLLESLTHRPLNQI